MITLKEINLSDKEEYAYFEEILQASFPECEHRPLNELRNITDTKNEFHVNLVICKKTPVGILSFWEFNDFIYIEHFAIEGKKRSGGFGGISITEFCKKIQKPIVLEVEMPEDEVTIKRIDFYKRKGFNLWDIDYLQPPYRKGDNYFPLRIMVYGNLSPEKDYNRIKNTLYREIYNVK